MNAPRPLAGLLLDRLRDDGHDSADRLIADLRKGTRELAALSLNYNGHSIRAGMYNATVSAIDGELDRASTILSRVLFDLQQRLLLDVQTLTRLARMERVVDLEDERPLVDRIIDGLDHYVAALASNLEGTRSTVSDVAVRLRVLANNTEIAACRTGEAAGVPIELFVAIAGQMRALALRLYTISDDITLFEQTQSGHAEAVRLAVLTQRDDPVLASEEAA